MLDSLGGVAHDEVFLTLREYLNVEYQVKYPNAPVKNYLNMNGVILKVPKQPNLTDCGLFLLENVETFFKKPIQNYRSPIKSLLDWFNPLDVVAHKRGNIVNVIKRLMTLQGGNVAELPKF